jgi:glycerol-3-phosphate dehydrogenase
MFVLPWGAHTYVGTTDTDFAGSPADVRADAADVDYLLKSANSVFPSAKLTDADVVSTWAGVRPLLAPRKGGRERERHQPRARDLVGPLGAAEHRRRQADHLPGDGRPGWWTARRSG